MNISSISPNDPQLIPHSPSHSVDFGGLGGDMEVKRLFGETQTFSKKYIYTQWVVGGSKADEPVFQ